LAWSLTFDVEKAPDWIILTTIQRDVRIITNCPGQLISQVDHRLVSSLPFHCTICNITKTVTRLGLYIGIFLLTCILYIYEIKIYKTHVYFNTYYLCIGCCIFVVIGVICTSNLFLFQFHPVIKIAMKDLSKLLIDKGCTTLYGLFRYICQYRFNAVYTGRLLQHTSYK